MRRINMLDLTFSIFSLYGAILLFYRCVWQRTSGNEKSFMTFDMPELVSIIIPCRNEEDNIPILLNSIKNLSYPNLEVIVVDDNSTDATANIVRKHNCKLLSLSGKNKSWAGKPWACQQGANIATGEYLLFTDADTTLEKDSIERSISYMKIHKLDLMSSVPYHLCQDFWEKILCSFHVFLLAVTRPFAKDINRDQLFAIGQYMLFKKSSYLKIKGHESVKNYLVEDLSLAKEILKQDLNYGVYNGKALFSVRMYSNLDDFIAGWRRNIRGGIRTLQCSMIFEVGAFYFAALHTINMSHPIMDTISLVLCYSTLFISLKWMGDFSPISLLLTPLNFILFLWINVLSLFDTLLNRNYTWKERSYSTENIGQ